MRGEGNRKIKDSDRLCFGCLHCVGLSLAAVHILDEGTHSVW